uniref:rab GTPase-binding effector protein 1-like n=1 Tax=Panthera onca TaxID=9690 RepID=UPI002954FBDE
SPPLPSPPLPAEDLKRQNAVLQAAQDDLGQLRTQLWEAQAEVENIKAIATVSENTKQEAIDEVKRQWREEVASLQAVMKETVRDYEHQFHLRLEQERSQWAQYRESAEREIADLRRRLSEGQEEENLENEMKKEACPDHATQHDSLPSSPLHLPPLRPSPYPAVLCPFLQHTQSSPVDHAFPSLLE